VARSRALNGARRSAALLALAVLALATPRCARAQQERPRVHPEVRLDAFAARPNAAQLGAGVQLPLGYYARFGIVAAGGVREANDDIGGSARVDAIMRYMLDPFREARWGLSAGAGVSVRWDEGYGWRPYLALVVDLEGGRPRTTGWSPALQLGLGGGVRFGIGLRRGTRGFR
jgi:hypothetical protein